MRLSATPVQPKAHLYGDRVLGCLSGQAIIDVFTDTKSAQGPISENCSDEGYYLGIKLGQFY